LSGNALISVGILTGMGIVDIKSIFVNNAITMPRKKNILDRKEQILQAADRLFNHYSYEKTTMEDISKESGIPRATIYLEFSGGKEDILIANMERYMRQMLAEMRAMAKVSKNGRLETLKQAMLYYVLSAHDKSISAQFDPNNMDRHTKRIRGEMGEYFKARTEFFAEMLDQAVLAGEVPGECETKRLAEVIAHGLNCFLPPLNLRLSREVLEKDANTFFSLLLSGLAKQSRTLAL
jgi:AcrR family transcriptional regulator